MWVCSMAVPMEASSPDALDVSQKGYADHPAGTEMKTAKGRKGKGRGRCRLPSRDKLEQVAHASTRSTSREKKVVQPVPHFRTSLTQLRRDDSRSRSPTSSTPRSGRLMTFSPPRAVASSVEELLPIDAFRRLRADKPTSATPDELSRSTIEAFQIGSGEEATSLLTPLSRYRWAAMVTKGIQLQALGLGGKLVTVTFRLSENLELLHLEVSGESRCVPLCDIDNVTTGLEAQNVILQLMQSQRNEELATRQACVLRIRRDYCVALWLPVGAPSDFPLHLDELCSRLRLASTNLGQPGHLRSYASVPSKPAERKPGSPTRREAIAPFERKHDIQEHMLASSSEQLGFRLPKNLRMAPKLSQDLLFSDKSSTSPIHRQAICEEANKVSSSGGDEPELLAREEHTAVLDCSPRALNGISTHLSHSVESSNELSDPSIESVLNSVHQHFMDLQGTLLECAAKSMPRRLAATGSSPMLSPNGSAVLVSASTPKRQCSQRSMGDTIARRVASISALEVSSEQSLPALAKMDRSQATSNEVNDLEKEAPLPSSSTYDVQGVNCNNSARASSLSRLPPLPSHPPPCSSSNTAAVEAPRPRFSVTSQLSSSAQHSPCTRFHMIGETDATVVGKHWEQQTSALDSTVRSWTSDTVKAPQPSLKSLDSEDSDGCLETSPLVFARHEPKNATSLLNSSVAGTGEQPESHGSFENIPSQPIVNSSSTPPLIESKATDELSQTVEVHGSSSHVSSILHSSLALQPQVLPINRDTEFVVELQRTSEHDKLGLDVDVNTFNIFNVRNGIASAYNETTAQEKQIQPGDRIIEVNGVANDCEAMLEMFKAKKITLVVRRARPAPLETVEVDESGSVTTLPERNEYSFWDAPYTEVVTFGKEGMMVPMGSEMKPSQQLSEQKYPSQTSSDLVVANTAITDGTSLCSNYGSLLQRSLPTSQKPASSDNAFIGPNASCGQSPSVAEVTASHIVKGTKAPVETEKTPRQCQSNLQYVAQPTSNGASSRTVQNLVLPQRQANHQNGIVVPKATGEQFPRTYEVIGSPGLQAMTASFPLRASGITRSVPSSPRGVFAGTSSWASPLQPSRRIAGTSSVPSTLQPHLRISSADPPLRRSIVRMRTGTGVELRSPQQSFSPGPPTLRVSASAPNTPRILGSPRPAFTPEHPHIHTAESPRSSLASLVHPAVASPRAPCQLAPSQASLCGTMRSAPVALPSTSVSNSSSTVWRFM